VEGDSPLDDLRAQLEAVELPAGVSIIDGPTSQLKAPAVVIRPDEPWLVPSKFCADEQRYVAIAVVTASTPSDGVRKLYAVVKAIKNAVSGAWSWEAVSAPIIDQSTGTAFLVSSVRLKYNNSEE
jgi:hypothetical protein